MDKETDIISVVNNLIYEKGSAVKRVQDDVGILYNALSDMKSSIEIIGSNSPDSLSLALRQYNDLVLIFTLLDRDLSSCDALDYSIDMISRLDSLKDDEKSEIISECKSLKNEVLEKSLDKLNEIKDDFFSTFSSLNSSLDSLVFSYIDKTINTLNSNFVFQGGKNF